MPLPAFFAPSDAGLVPHPSARGPWAPDMLHGRLLAGLAAWAIERDHGDPEFQPVRLTVDLFRNPPMQPATLTTTIVRAGGRVRAVDASIGIDGVEVARASCLYLRRGDAPHEAAPPTPAWAAPHPDELPVGDLPVDMPFDVREIDGRGVRSVDRWPRQVWLRDRCPLVAGHELSPFVRAALAADFANPLANFGSDGLDYINADATLHLGREPVGEWIGVATDDRVAADGVSVAQCVYHDVTGPIGWSTVCAVRNPRMGSTG